MVIGGRPKLFAELSAPAEFLKRRKSADDKYWPAIARVFSFAREPIKFADVDKRDPRGRRHARPRNVPVHARVRTYNNKREVRRRREKSRQNDSGARRIRGVRGADRGKINIFSPSRSSGRPLPYIYVPSLPNLTFPSTNLLRRSRGPGRPADRGAPSRFSRQRRRRRRVCRAE